MSLQSIIETRYSAIDVDTYRWSLTELCDLYRQDKLIFPEKQSCHYLEDGVAALLESLILGIPGMPLYAYVQPDSERWEFFDVKRSRKLKQLIEFILGSPGLKRIVCTTRGFSHWQDVGYKDITPTQQKKLQLSKFPITLISGDRQLATSYINSRYESTSKFTNRQNYK